MGPTPGRIDDDLEAVDSIDAEEQDDAAVEIEESRARIEQTRSEMTDTIDAIKDKLSPQHLMQQAKETMREATVGKAQEMASNVVDSAKQAASTAVEGAERVMSSASNSAREAGSTVMGTIQRNPLPSALIGLGLSWLWMNASRENAERRSRVRRYEYTAYPEYGASTDYEEQRVYGTSAPDGEKSGVVDKAREAVGGAIDTAKEAVGGAVHTTRDAMGNVVEAARDTGSSTIEVIQRNPLPAALLATSVGWLWMNARKQSDAGYDYPSRPLARDYPNRYDSTYSARYGTEVEHGQHPSDRTGFQQAAQGAQERVSDLTERVKDRVGDVGSTLQHQAHRATDTYERWMQENPLAVGAMAVALGAAVGMAIPETPQEHRVMGEARDRLVDRAQEVTQEVAQKVQSVAHEAIDTAREEARTQGLTS